MARSLKWILGIVGGLILLTIIGVFILLSSYDFNNLKPMISKAAYNATGRELTIDSDINLDIGLSPSLVLSGIKFKNADWGSRKEMVKINQFEIKVALLPLIKGNIEVKRFILKEPDILIETSKTGKSNLDFKATEQVPEKKDEVPTAVQEEMELPSLTVNELEIIDGTITYKDGSTGKSETVSINKLTADIQGLDDPVNFNLNGAYNNEPLNVSGSLGNLKGVRDPDISWPVTLVIKAFDAVINVNGSIKNPVEQHGINLDFGLKVNKWNKLSKIAGQDILLKDSLSVSGQLNDRAKNVYEIKGLKIILGNNILGGSIGLDISKNIPNLDVVLSSKSIDLKPFLIQEEAKGKNSDKQDQASEKTTRIFPDDLMTFDVLKLVDGKFKIEINKVILPQIVINNLTLDSTMNKGNLAVNPLKANIGGGIVALNLNVVPGDNTSDISTTLEIQGLEIGEMLKEAGITDMVEGTMDVDVDLKGKGNSVASIMASMNGYTNIIMGQGKIKNKYIDLLGGDFSKGIFRLLSPSTYKKQNTAIRCMVNRFDITDGIADATAFVFDTNMMSVTGEGDIDLSTEKLNISLNPSAKGGIAGYSLSLGELAKPFKLGGTLAQPSLALDKKKAAIAIGKAIGGKVLFGPVGIVASLVGKSSDSDENPCVSAIETAKTGVKKSGKKEPAADEESSPVTPKKIIEDVIKTPGKALKTLFGR